LKRDTRKLSNRRFDLLVIGAGMFGVSVAWSAVLRGYSVAIIDKSDFGAATSANHYKLIHSGIRYLQHADFARMRESSRERSALIRTAPHLCAPLPIVIPTYGKGKKGLGLMRMGMLAYDLLSSDRNRHISDPTRKTPNGSSLDRESVLKMFPGLDPAGLTGAAVISDGQIYNPTRLTLSILRAAVNRGALAVNYMAAERLVIENSIVTGCIVTDKITGQTLEVKSKFVVNATGPWTEQFIKNSNDLPLSKCPSFSRDLAFVIDKSISTTHALGCQAKTNDRDAVLSRGGRHLFLIPWRNKTLVGVWHRYSNLNPDNLPVSKEELSLYVDEVNSAYKDLNITLSDISLINTGHILFGNLSEQKSDKEHSFAKRSLLIDHSIDGIEGLLSVVGARATVARGTAEKVLKLVDTKLKKTNKGESTETSPIFGGDFDSFEKLTDDIRHVVPGLSDLVTLALARNYGSAYRDVLAYCPEQSSIAPLGHSSVLNCEIIHAIRHEMAISLSDIVFRRTELCTGGHPGEDALIEAANIASLELGWSEEKKEREVKHVSSILVKNGPWFFYQTEDEMPDEIGIPM